MNDAEVIVALGDTAAVADLLGVAQNTVTNWKARGIAWRYRPQLKDYAKRKRISIPDDFLSTRRALNNQAESE